MVQFFLQDETERLESRAQTDLEEMLDENMLAFDIRETAYQVALTQHLDDVAAKLREWGYDAEYRQEEATRARRGVRGPLR